jgi:hypothetical protein
MSVYFNFDFYTNRNRVVLTRYHQCMYIELLNQITLIQA